MPLLTKECLERLRERIDLQEIVGSHIELKRVGGKIKALCPFHNEKTPSFTVTGGDSHYHCFGCGAHGDAVAFLMNFLGVSFNEAVEYLADKYHIKLEYTGVKETASDYKKDLYRINQKVAEFFHFHLLHSEEGKVALEYLFKRGISEDFIKQFMVGYAPKEERFQKAFYKSENFSEELLVLAGILTEGVKRPFFSERIMFPIHNGVGQAIGFSGRKINENVFGGKYINTKETEVFKKSKTLFGLNYSRRRIAKEGKVIIVEGQIDALRLIFEGFDYTVASQGTAFGVDHVQELMKLGVNEVIICFDGDEAGDKSAVKVGQLFQKEGANVSVCRFSKGVDPDTFLLEYGKGAFEKLLEQKQGYLPFLLEMLSLGGKADSPAGKNAVISEVKKMIGEWRHPIMIHEGEKALSRLMGVPGQYIVTSTPPPPTQKVRVQKTVLDLKKDVLEQDLIRWLLLTEEKDLLDLMMDNIEVEYLHDPKVIQVFTVAKKLHLSSEKIDSLHLGISLSEEQFRFLEEVKGKRMNTLKAKEGIKLLCQKILDREWLKRCDEIRTRIQEGGHTEEQMFALAKEFDRVKKNKITIMERK